jgi:NAD(P)-dependent dehydrogenase (short-subunit alcohol dehydrogenase family)
MPWPSSDQACVRRPPVLDRRARPGGTSSPTSVTVDGSIAADLAGLRVAITGAGRGIGARTAQTLARAGARLVISDVNDDWVSSVTEALTSDGGEVVGRVVDVRRQADCLSLAGLAQATFGGLDVLINNAGVLPVGSVTETSVEDWDRAMEVNVRGTFLCSKAVIPLMQRQRRGHILNLASGAALVAMRGVAAYAASKAAVVSLTKCMAIDHARDGIRVNCICPGGVDTEMLAPTLASTGKPEEAASRFAAEHLVGRLAQPQEIAELIAFMISPRCEFMTGSAVVFDGGLTIGSRRDG